MSFISFKFLLILPLVAALYQILPVRCRVLFLLIASYGYICTANFKAAGILAAATLFTFRMGQIGGDSSFEKRSRVPFWCGISGLTLILLFFKAVAALPVNRAANLVIPLGLSYYTFKLMSYLIDVDWGKIEPARSLEDFAAAIAFFPQIAAGPIQRPASFFQQLPPARTAVWLGLSRLVWGLAKKILIADNLAPTVNYVFEHIPSLHGASLLAGFYLFPLQMYADFSALTDVALGMGLLFGIVGPENFNRPFTASSISDFWRRWHMSLTNWLADYVFLPLRMATRSAGTVGLVLSITLNMLAVGLWHGFTWGYFIFGALNAAYLVGDALTVRSRSAFFKARPGIDRWGGWAGCLFTLHLFFLAMVFFRASAPHDALSLLSHALSGLNSFRTDLAQLAAATGSRALMIGLAGYVFLELAERLRPDLWWKRMESTAPVWVRGPARCALAIGILASLFVFTVRPGAGQESAFLYQVF